MQTNRLFFAVTFLLATQFASAQIVQPTRPDKWEFSGFFGLSNASGPGSFVTQGPNNGTQVVQLETESGYLAGVRLSENLGRFFGAELEYSLANQPMGLTNLSPSLPRLDISQRVHTVSYNGVVYAAPRLSKIRPFGTFGAGASLYQLTGKTEARGVAAGLDLRDRWQLAFTWGGGVKVSTGKRWGVRVDFRDTITSVPDFGIPRASQLVSGVLTPAFRPDGVLHRFQFSGGLYVALRP